MSKPTTNLMDLYPRIFRLMATYGIKLSRRDVSREDSPVTIVPGAIFEHIKARRVTVPVDKKKIIEAGFDQKTVPTYNHRVTFFREATVAAFTRREGRGTVMIDVETLYSDGEATGIDPTFTNYKENLEWWIGQAGIPWDLLVYTDRLGRRHGFPLDIDRAEREGLYLPDNQEVSTPDPQEVFFLPVLRQNKIVTSALDTVTGKRIYANGQVSYGANVGYMIERVDHILFYPIEEEVDPSENVFAMVEHPGFEALQGTFYVLNQVYNIEEQLEKHGWAHKSDHAIKMALAQKIKDNDTRNFKMNGHPSAVAHERLKRLDAWNFYVAFRDAYKALVQEQAEDSDTHVEPDASLQEEVGA